MALPSVLKSKLPAVAGLGTLLIVGTPLAVKAAFSHTSIASSSDLNTSSKLNTSNDTPKQLTKSSVKVQSSIDSNNSNPSPPTAHVTVNGQSIKVPPNSSVHKSMTSNDGQTKVNISVDNRSSSHNTSSSSTDVNVNSQSSSLSITEVSGSDN